MVLAITKSLGSLTFAWLALANDANVSGVSEERPFYFNRIYGSYSFIEMPRELMRLNRVPFVITLHKSQANMLQNVTEKGYERSIKKDIITQNVPSKQICIPCCLSGLGTGYKNHHFSLEQNWAEAPIVESIDRLSIESWDDSPHTSASTVQDHAITLLLLKISRCSYQVELHLHSIHKFFSVIQKIHEITKNLNFWEMRPCLMKWISILFFTDHNTVRIT